MNNKEENINHAQNSTHIGGQQMSSSLKERLKRSSRAFSSPILKSSMKIPLNTKRCTNYQSSENFLDMMPLSLDDIDTCFNKEHLEKMHYHLKSKILANEEKIKKLELVEHYNLKNKPDDLVHLIQKWLTASQEALKKLFKKHPENEIDILGLLNLLNIDNDIVKYDPDCGIFY